MGLVVCSSLQPSPHPPSSSGTALQTPLPTLRLSLSLSQRPPCVLPVRSIFASLHRCRGLSANDTISYLFFPSLRAMGKGSKRQRKAARRSVKSVTKDDAFREDDIDDEIDACKGKRSNFSFFSCPFSFSCFISLNLLSLFN